MQRLETADSLYKASNNFDDASLLYILIELTF